MGKVIIINLIYINFINIVDKYILNIRKIIKLKINFKLTYYFVLSIYFKLEQLLRNYLNTL